MRVVQVLFVCAVMLIQNVISCKLMIRLQVLPLFYNQAIYLQSDQS